jgi:hypothetical protein
MTVKRIGTSPKVTICERYAGMKVWHNQGWRVFFIARYFIFSNFKMVPTAVSDYSITNAVGIHDFALGPNRRAQDRERAEAASRAKRISVRISAAMRNS